jgi:hypothetical protein
MRDYGMAAVGAERKFDEPAISEKGQNRSLRTPLGRWARIATPGLPRFSALSREGQRSGRDIYDLDLGSGLGSLCKRSRIACPRRR